MVAGANQNFGRSRCLAQVHRRSRLRTTFHVWADLPGIFSQIVGRAWRAMVRLSDNSWYDHVDLRGCRRSSYHSAHAAMQVNGECE